MKARIVARGFINKFTARGELLFCDVVLQYAKQNFKYRALVDKALAKTFVDIKAVVGDSVDELNKYFTKSPQVLCLANPVAKIEDGEIVYTGVLLAYTTQFDIDAGWHNKAIFGDVME